MNSKHYNYHCNKFKKLIFAFENHVNTIQSKNELMMFEEKHQDNLRRECTSQCAFDQLRIEYSRKCVDTFKISNY